MDPRLIMMIDGAVNHAKAKHPGGLGAQPYAVLAEEVGEAARAFLEEDLGHEQKEILDIIAVCVRRLEQIDDHVLPEMQKRIKALEARWKALEEREKALDARR